MNAFFMNDADVLEVNGELVVGKIDDIEKLYGE